MQVLCFHGHACNLPLRSQCCGLFGISWGGEALWEPKLSSKLPGDSRSVLYHKAWPTLHGSTPIKDCNAGERRAGITPPTPNQQLGSGVGEIPFPGGREGKQGSARGFSTSNPAPSPHKPMQRLLGSSWDRLQLLGLMDLRSCTSSTRFKCLSITGSPNAALLDSRISLGKAEIPKPHP